MPADRRRRFRRPGTGRWITETLPALRLELAPTVRSTLTAWMRLYGEANSLPGLATGPIESRFQRLREHAAADTIVVWSTPTRWAAGEGLSLRIPALRLELACTLGDGRLYATKASQVPEDERPPERESGAVGVYARVNHIHLPPEQVDTAAPDPGVALLEAHFARLAGRRWGGFVEPLRAALEAEAREDEARTQRLTVPYKTAVLVRGGEEDVWKLSGVPAEAVRAFEDGEWVDLLDPQGRSTGTARVIHQRPSEGSLEIGVRASSDPPSHGFVRPRSRRKILDQKRALLDELESPTGSLPHLVRLVAAPASVPVPRTERPQRFVNAAVMRNRSQARAVGMALGLEDGQAMLIQGPPGTGKSTTAAEIDVQLILRDPGVRILVCSHSNHGTDNMLMKVLPYLEDAQERIARIGFYDRVAKDARPYYCPSDADLGDRNVIFTTIDALALQDIAGATVYDYVILDEANRAGVLDSLLALARGKRMIMVGDAMQLQPVMSEAEQQMVASQAGEGRGRRSGALAMAPAPGPNNVIGKSLFAWLQERRFAPGAVVLLDQQNRMHPAIGELVSRVFYGGRVRPGPAAPRRGTGMPVFPSPVMWVDTRSLRGNVESRAGGTSLFNVAEARLVSTITHYLASHAPPGLTIGVIAAYAEQRDLLRRLMGPRDWPPERQLEIDTVDAFEGREKDIIVLSLVRANRRRDVGFLRLEQRLNVAVSRARRLITIVGDTSTLRGGYFNQLVRTTQSVGQVVAAPKLIGQLTGRTRGRRRERGRRPETGEIQARTTLETATGEGEAPEQRLAAEHGEAITETRRRRRRRAWDRRRERLRHVPGQQEQAPEGETAPTSDRLGLDVDVPTEAPTETAGTEAYQPVVPNKPTQVENGRLRTTRPRRLRRQPEAETTEIPAEAPTQNGVMGTHATEPEGPPEQPAEATAALPKRPRARRVRKEAEAPVERLPGPVQAPEPEAPVEEALAPRRRRTARKTTEPAAP